MCEALGVELSRRAAVEGDVPFLMDLRRRTMTTHQIAAGVAPSDEERKTRVLFRYDCAEILMCDGQAVGLLKVARDGQKWELIQIQLMPDMQGRGLGRHLIERLILEAKNARATLELTVLNRSPARRLYERLGFFPVEQSEHSLSMRLIPGAV